MGFDVGQCRGLDVDHLRPLARLGFRHGKRYWQACSPQGLQTCNCTAFPARARHDDLRGPCLIEHGSVVDDELELTEPEHPDAKEAAASTTRLLVHLRDKHKRAASEKPANAETEPDRKNDDAEPS